jgi:hypothetical protein
VFFGDGEHVLPAQELSHFLGKHKMTGGKTLLSVQVFLTISYENTQTTVVSIENGLNPNDHCILNTFGASSSIILFLFSSVTSVR